jgi:hypothetical protein
LCCPSYELSSIDGVLVHDNYLSQSRIVTMRIVHPP